MITTTFKGKRVRKKNKMFNCGSVDDAIASAGGTFRIDFFITMLDAVIQDINPRFTALTEYYKNCGFLYDINNLKFNPEPGLKKCNPEPGSKTPNTKY